MSYLRGYKSAIGKGQREAVERVISEMSRRGEVRSAYEIKLARERLNELVSATEPYEPKFDPERILSTDFNDNYEAVYIYLQGIYEQLLAMEKTVSKNREITESLRNSVRSSLRSLDKDLKQIRFLKNNPEYTEYKYLSITDGRNLTQARNPAQVDVRSKSVRLPLRRSTAPSQERGPNGAKLETTVLTTSGVNVSSKTFRPENALDADERSFWSEVYFSDTPVVTEFTDAAGNTSTYNGLIIKASIQFAQPTYLSQIQINPQTKFPFLILEVQTDGVSWNWSKKKADPLENEEIQNGWYDLSGDRVTCEKVDIFFLQQNYSLVDYQVPRWVSASQKIWEYMIDQRLLNQLASARSTDQEYYESSVSPGRIAFIQDRRDLEAVNEDLVSNDAQADNQVQRLVEAVMSMLAVDESAFSKLVTTGDKPDSTKQEDIVTISKHEYQMGAFSIVCYDRTYQRTGVWETPHFSILGQIEEVELDTDTFIPETSSVLARTPSVSFAPPPATAAGTIDWSVRFTDDRSVPILPKGTTSVVHEQSPIDWTNQEFRLRFGAANNSTIQVYRNKVLEGQVTGNGGQVYTIPVASGSAYTRADLYTFTYTPVTGSDVINLADRFDSIPTSDFYEETSGNGVIQLRYIPYLERSIVNDITNWTETSPGVWQLASPNKAFYYDGQSYGEATTTANANFNASATTITASGPITTFPSKGTLLVVSTGEKIFYSGKSGNDFTGCIRGWDDTTQASISTSDDIILDGSPQYEPIKVFVNGEKASNITDYDRGEHQAFSAPNDPRSPLQFVQVGRKLYLSRAQTNATIEVQYRYMAQYLSVEAVIRNTEVSIPLRSPEIRSVGLRLRSER